MHVLQPGFSSEYRIWMIIVSLEKFRRDLYNSNSTILLGLVIPELKSPPPPPIHYDLTIRYVDLYEIQLVSPTSLQCRLNLPHSLSSYWVENCPSRYLGTHPCHLYNLYGFVLVSLSIETTSHHHSRSSSWVENCSTLESRDPPGDLDKRCGFWISDKWSALVSDFNTFWHWL